MGSYVNVVCLEWNNLRKIDIARSVNHLLAVITSRQSCTSNFYHIVDPKVSRRRDRRHPPRHILSHFREVWIPRG